MAWTRSTGWQESCVQCARGRSPLLAMACSLKTWAHRAPARRTAAIINIGVLLMTIASIAPSADVVPNVPVSLTTLPRTLVVLAFIATSTLASLLLLVNFDRTESEIESIHSPAGNQVELSTAEPVRGMVQQMQHDLRTPLNAIIGFSDMMQQQMHGPLGSDHYQEYVAYIRESGETLLVAIEGTLAITQRLAEQDQRQS